MDGDRKRELPAKGRLVVGNTSRAELGLLVEPWGIGCQLQPGQQAHVYLCEPDGSVPVITFGDGIISVFAAGSRIEVGGAVVFDGGEMGEESAATGHF